MRIFVLEDDPTRLAWFMDACVHHELILATSVDEALRAYVGDFDFMSLDHDLGGETYVSSNNDNTGAAFVRAIAPSLKNMEGRVIIHSYNYDGATEMALEIKKHAWFLPPHCPFLGPMFRAIWAQVIQSR